MAKDPSRTEEATPRRINKAREDGNAWKSQEITKTLAVVGGVTGLAIWIGYIGNNMGNIIRHFMSTAILTFRPEPSEVIGLCLMVAIELAKMILPVIIFIGIIVFVVLRVQVGTLWTTKVFKPKLSKFNPISGIKRMLFSLDTVVRTVKSVLQAVCIGIAPWIVIKGEMATFPTLYDVNAAHLIWYMLTLGLKVTMWAMVPMIAFMVFDFFYSRWQYSENLKMTKDEVKDERKQMEGDPIVKSKQRQKMMQMSARRMMQEVPKADVVITNPTHIAIAIRYNSLEAPAPIVLAKGADKVAEKIKEIAREHKVPIRENKPLARALYKQVEVGDMIPEDFYQAVAAILAQIWKTRPRPQGQTIAAPKK